MFHLTNCRSCHLHSITVWAGSVLVTEWQAGGRFGHILVQLTVPSIGSQQEIWRDGSISLPAAPLVKFVEAVLWTQWTHWKSCHFESKSDNKDANAEECRPERSELHSRPAGEEQTEVKHVKVHELTFIHTVQQRNTFCCQTRALRRVLSTSQSANYHLFQRSLKRKRSFIKSQQRKAWQTCCAIISFHPYLQNSPAHSPITYHVHLR